MTKRFVLKFTTTYEDKAGKVYKNTKACGTVFLRDTEKHGEVGTVLFDFIPTPAPGGTLEFSFWEPKAKEAAEDDNDPVTED